MLTSSFFLLSLEWSVVLRHLSLSRVRQHGLFQLFCLPVRISLL